MSYKVLPAPEPVKSRTSFYGRQRSTGDEAARDGLGTRPGTATRVGPARLSVD